MTFFVVFLILLFVPGLGTMLILWFPGKPDIAHRQPVQRRSRVRPASKFVLQEMPAEGDGSLKPRYRIVENHPVIRDAIVREYTVGDHAPVKLFRQWLESRHAGLG